MRGLPDEEQSRREFFRAAARYGALGILTVAGALMAGRTRVGIQQCLNRGICSGCGLLAKCGLPATLSNRAAKKEGQV